MSALATLEDRAVLRIRTRELLIEKAQDDQVPDGITPDDVIRFAANTLGMNLGPAEKRVLRRAYAV